MKLMATLFLLSVIVSFPVRPASAAEIININYKYKVAFTDLTENDVKAGDRVMVLLPDGKSVPMKVVETFPVMAKLTFSDGAEALTEEQISAVNVGSPVRVAGAVPAPSVKAPEAAKAVRVVVRDDVPKTVETYSPPENISPVVVKAPVEAKGVALPPAPVQEGRSDIQEQRLDQMMLNNVKLAESVTKLLAEKNAAEALAQEKTAEAASARKNEIELTREKGILEQTVQGLRADIAVFEQENAAQKKEIEILTGKLGELKKKLAKMVEIVNTNMKAYEKQ